MPEKLRMYINGEKVGTASGVYKEVFDPSEGSVQALAPSCTKEELDAAVMAAANAFPAWSQKPVNERVQILYRFRDLVVQHLDELTDLVCRENGKTWSEGKGDVLKVKEIVEHACGMPSLMQGDSMLDTTLGFDTVLYREPVGVFAGIAPFNFPAMIPMGWMMPLCIASGNTLVLKASSQTPLTSLRCAELLTEAGLPAGVVNVITCGRDVAADLLGHPKIAGVSFVGSTTAGRKVYEQAAKAGMRVQALCEAKNHALVLRDCQLERTARAIINAAFGCAGERCMALPVVVVEEPIADRLVDLLCRYAKELKIGPAYDQKSDLGPVVSQAHRQRILKWVETGIEEGAQLVLDGRDVTVPGYERGFYLGPFIFDQVRDSMKIGQEEIFGPVLSVKRVKSFEKGLALMNANRFANGSVIFTQSGYYSREFVRRTDGGMVGINVGIPVPVGSFPFSGHKQSFFGDLHTLGKDGMRFYTQSKTVTSRWFEPDAKDEGKVGTWER